MWVKKEYLTSVGDGGLTVTIYVLNMLHRLYITPTPFIAPTARVGGLL